MKQERVIPYDSPKAAKRVRMTGWRASNGRFWGDDEHMARFDGSTHSRCKGGCGELVPHRGSNYCKACTEVRRIAGYRAMPKQIWDGETFLYSDAREVYFQGREELAEYLGDHPDVTLDSLHLVICEPIMASEIDGNEHFGDELHEDGEISPELAAAFDALNAVIRKEPPLSWSSGDYAAIVTL